MYNYVYISLHIIYAHDILNLSSPLPPLLVSPQPLLAPQLLLVLQLCQALLQRLDVAVGQVQLLQKVLESEPENADAYNYLGYSHRQLGKTDEAVGFYQKALALDPDHLGANEYLGELWLQVGDLPKAEQRLEVLDGACFFGCDQYYKLRDAIRAHKQKAGG